LKKFEPAPLVEKRTTTPTIRTAAARRPASPLGTLACARGAETGHIHPEETMVPTLVLLGLYVVVTIGLQFAGYLVSGLVGLYDPKISLMTFLVLFMGMFWLGWPISVRLSDWLVPETELERGVRLSRG
jgi:hypothetical protein